MAELPPINARLDGPFRTNVRRLLSEVAEPQPCSLAGTTKWKIAFSDGQGGTDDLLVFEEDVEKTGKLYCEQCRVIGEEKGSSLFAFWRFQSFATTSFFAVQLCLYLSLCSLVLVWALMPLCLGLMPLHQLFVMRQVVVYC
jgi:hypothetical protein